MQLALAATQRSGTLGGNNRDPIRRNAVTIFEQQAVLQSAKRIAENETAPSRQS